MNSQKSWFLQKYKANLSTKSIIYQFAVAMATGTFSKKTNIKSLFMCGPQHFLIVSWKSLTMRAGPHLQFSGPYME